MKTLEELGRDQKILADAILELAAKAAIEWDYDDEQMLSTGVGLGSEADLQRIAGDK
jgi:hypothetical protein